MGNLRTLGVTFAALGLCAVVATAMTNMAWSEPYKLAKSEDAATLSSFNTSETGLRWKDHAEGEGTPAKPGDKVTVHYTGWLYPSGKKFDSSVDHGRPLTFTLGRHQVIEGWDEGLKGMKPGGKRTLIIPPQLGYGEDGASPVIPPNATLKFDVELIKAGK